MADTAYTTALVAGADYFEKAKHMKDPVFAQKAAAGYSKAASLAPHGYAMENCIANAQRALEMYRTLTTRADYEGRTSTIRQCPACGQHGVHNLINNSSNVGVCKRCGCVNGECSLEESYHYALPGLVR